MDRSCWQRVGGWSYDDGHRESFCAGTLPVIYGSQAYSGAINIVTRRPEAGARLGELRGGFGSGGASLGEASYRFASAAEVSGLVAASLERGDRQPRRRRARDCCRSSTCWA
ncbi:MAG: hypothetical protein V1750_06125 [Acidobacteriota bacterium]